MLKMSERTKEFLITHLPGAIDSTDVNVALDMLYDWIDLNGFASDGLYNSRGREAQMAYDDLFQHND